MDDFWKTTALVLLTVILGLSLDKTERDISAVMGIVALCVAACAAVTILSPVLDYLVELQRLFQLPDSLVSILMKAVGIALVAELSATICADAGNASLGKMLQIYRKDYKLEAKQNKNKQKKVQLLAILQT